MTHIVLDIINGTDINDTVLAISKFISALAIIGGFIGGAIKFIKFEINKITKDEMQGYVKNEMENYREESNKSFNSIKVELANLQNTLNEFIKVSTQADENMRKTMCDTVREKIWRIHRDCMKAGRISDHEWYIVNELWDDYNNRLDGNSFVGDLVSDLRDLHTKSMN